jgi:hypothetical protein
VAAVPPPEDLAGVTEGHALDRADEYLLGLGRGLLGSAVHPDFQFVDLRPLAQHTHPLAHGLQFRGQQDLDGLVLQEAVGFAGKGNGPAGAHLQRFFEAGGDFVVAEARGVGAAQAFIGSFQDVLELRRRSDTAEGKDDGDQGGSHVGLAARNMDG